MHVVFDLRMRWTADDGRDFGDNPGFRMWMLDRPPREGQRIAMRSYLDARQCYKLWRYLGRTDQIPKRLYIELNREDVMRKFPPH